MSNKTDRAYSGIGGLAYYEGFFTFLPECMEKFDGAQSSHGAIRDAIHCLGS
jgi:hypothetical protein